MRTRSTLALVTILALGAAGLAGCGSDGSSAKESEPSESSTTDASPTSRSDDAGSGGTDGSGALASDECRQLADAFDQDQFSGSFTDGNDPTENLERAAAALRDAADEVPDEIRDDVETLADAYDELADEAADVDWDGLRSGNAAAIAAAAQLGQAFAATDFVEAATNLARYTASNCTP
jgi:hypothetical protein